MGSHGTAARGPNYSDKLGNHVSLMVYELMCRRELPWVVGAHLRYKHQNTIERRVSLISETYTDYGRSIQEFMIG